MTQAAALHDSRFPPVTPKEIPDLYVEISILIPMKKVRSFDGIPYPGYGVVVEREGKIGVFLPEVSSHFSTKEDFLNALCSEKEGLEKKCWKDPETDLFIFHADVIH